MTENYTVGPPQDETYKIPENPVYNTTMRKLQDDDPASASQTLNPLMERIIENTHAVKKQTDELTEKVEQGSGAVDLGELSPVVIGKDAAVHQTYAGAAVGTGADGTGTFSTALGSNSAANGNYSVALGCNAGAISNHTSAMGFTATASGMRATALGSRAEATGNGATALGANTQASGLNSTAIGINSKATAFDSVALGDNANADVFASIAIGINAVASNQQSVAVGAAANSLGTLSAALGAGAVATNNHSLAVGAGKALASRAIAIGSQTNAVGENSIAIGVFANAVAVNSTAIGHNSHAAASAVAMGSNANAAGASSVAIGMSAGTSDTTAVALGAGSRSVYSGTALGTAANASGNYSTAVGANANTGGSLYSTALGYNATVIAANSMRLGSANSSHFSGIYSLHSITISSDMRDKAEIQPIENALEFLNSIEPVQYVNNHRESYIHEDLTEEQEKLKEKYTMHGELYDSQAHAKGLSKGARKRVGVLAQDVREKMMEVYGTDNYAELVHDNLYDRKLAGEEFPIGVEEILSVNYTSFIPFLIKAVQDLTEKLRKLEEGH